MKDLDEKHNDLERRIKAAQNDIEQMDEYLKIQLELLIQEELNNKKLISRAKELLERYGNNNK